jgi:inner membrane protein
MDSVTQFVLGAAVGHVILGRHMGAGKAMLIGGLAGTIPDLDVIPLSFADMVTSLNYHRGISHSLLFSGFAPLIAAKLSKYFGDKKYPSISFWRWYWVWTLGFLTHILIDACTTWGTQIFWPLPYRISFNSVFIIDPAYTVPLIISLIIGLFFKHKKNISTTATSIGLIITTLYLIWCGVAKYQANMKFEAAFAAQNIAVTRYMTRPTPFNSFLWALTAETPDGYITGYYGLFDKQTISFSAILPKNHSLLTPYLSNPNMRTLIAITNGYYRVEKNGETLAIHDLRFGDFGSWNGERGQDIFVYLFTPKTGTFKQKERNIKNTKEALPSLWKRIMGNDYVADTDRTGKDLTEHHQPTRRHP